MFGGSEININFPKNIWVHLTYQTAFVDEDGKLQLREDVYGRDARMIAILKGSERKVADIAIERAPNTSSKPVRMPVGMYGGNGGYSGGPNFFDFLFGGGGAGRPPVPASATASGPRNGRVSSALIAASTRNANAGERFAGVFVLRDAWAGDGTGGWT